MAPAKKNKKEKVVKPVDFSSPASKRKLTIYRKDAMRRYCSMKCLKVNELNLCVSLEG